MTAALRALPYHPPLRTLSPPQCIIERRRGHFISSSRIRGGGRPDNQRSPSLENLHVLTTGAPSPVFRKRERRCTGRPHDARDALVLLDLLSVHHPLLYSRAVMPRSPSR